MNEQLINIIVGGISATGGAVFLKAWQEYRDRNDPGKEAELYEKLHAKLEELYEKNLKLLDVVEQNKVIILTLTEENKILKNGSRN